MLDRKESARQSLEKRAQVSEKFYLQRGIIYSQRGAPRRYKDRASKERWIIRGFKNHLGAKPISIHRRAWISRSR